MQAIRWIGRGLAAAGLLLACALGAAYARVAIQSARYFPDTPSRSLAVGTDSTTLARGRHLSDAVAGCVHCHGADFGGHVLIDDPMILRLSAPNLTRGVGGVINRYDDRTLERAIRRGLAHDGRVLRLMPSHEFAPMADDDIAAIVADLRSRPPVDRTVKSFRLGPVGTALSAAGKLKLFAWDQLDTTHRALAVAPSGRSLERGHYLSITCSGCHRKTFVGGPITGAPPDWPAAADITPSGIGRWTDAEFMTAMRTGVRPDGRRLNDAMPWKQFGGMTDDELLSLRMYLSTVPRRQVGPG
jgi:mono/diheme cytochrome c family protein